MKIAGRFAALLVTICVVVASAGFAQSPFDEDGMMNQMMYGPLPLLMRREVQKELKLDRSQNDALKKLQKEQMEAGKKLAEGMRGGDPTKALGMARQLQEQQNGYNQKAQEILREDQRKRLTEIRLQVLDFRAVFEPDTQTSLTLTDEQKQSLTALHSEYGQAKMETMQGASRNPSGFKGALESVDNAYRDKVAQVLTAEQNAKLKEMAGAPFKDAKKLSVF